MTREERKAARRREIFRTLGLIAACLLVYLIAHFTANAVMPM